MRNYIVLFLLVSGLLPLQAGVNATLRQAGKLYDQAKYGQALSSYEKVQQAAPSNTKATFGVGAAAYQLKDYEQAAQAFDTVAKEDTQLLGHDALFNLGNTYYRAGNKEQAIATYKQAIIQNPQDKEAVHNLQLVLQEQQNQQNQNNQNQQNQDQNSQNKDSQDQQNQAGQSPQQADQQPQQQQPSQLDKQAAQRVMQLARDNEYKRPTQPGANSDDNNVEKDW